MKRTETYDAPGGSRVEAGRQALVDDLQSETGRRERGSPVEDAVKGDVVRVFKERRLSADPATIEALVEIVSDTATSDQLHWKARIALARLLTPGGLHPETCALAIHLMEIFAEAGIPFLVGGSFALGAMVEIDRGTKDFDLYLRKRDIDRALEAAALAGYKTDQTFSHWLAKIYVEIAPRQHFTDLIFNSGNGLFPVDDDWFDHAHSGEVFGMKVGLTPPEELLCHKSCIMERERFDGGDVARVIVAFGSGLDWSRLLARFGRNWRILAAHLILFDYVFPGERGKIPDWVRGEIVERLEADRGRAPSGDKICNGTILSRQQYLRFLEKGYKDGRIVQGLMSEDEIRHWTEAIKIDGDRPGRV